MSNVFITISKLFLFLLNFLSSNKFLQQIAVKSNAKGEYHTQKKTKRGSKGQKTVCKIEKGKEQNVSKAKGKGKGKKQYKKGKKTAVETNRHCERASAAPTRQRMKQQIISKRVNFQRTKSNMPQIAKGKMTKGKCVKFQMATGEMSQIANGKKGKGQ